MLSGFGLNSLLGLSGGAFSPFNSAGASRGSSLSIDGIIGDLLNASLSGGSEDTFTLSPINPFTGKPDQSPGANLIWRNIFLSRPDVLLDTIEYRLAQRERDDENALIGPTQEQAESNNVRPELIGPTVDDRVYDNPQPELEAPAPEPAPAPAPAPEPAPAPAPVPEPAPVPAPTPEPAPVVDEAARQREINRATFRTLRDASGPNPRESFDEAFYLQRYPDVAIAIANGSYRGTARDHYMIHGAREGRYSNQQQAFAGETAKGSLGFDEARYLALNPDVAADVRSGNGFSSGFAHFISHGMYENRVFE